MEAALSSRDVLKPRGPDRIGRGLMLALIVHVGLIIAIAIGVNWRSRAPEAMSAELWSAVPQAAAPRLAEPDPTPPTPPPKPVPVPKPAPVPKVEPPPVRETPDAEIAIEKAKREKERKKQLEDEQAQREREERKKDQAAAAAAAAKQQELDRKKKLEDARREAEQKKAEEALRAQARKDQERIMGMANASGDSRATGSARQSSGPSANYAGRVEARIRPNITYTEDPTGNPFAEFEVRTAPDGTIVGTPRLTKSSGIPSWDDAALRAIIKTEILPRDIDGRVPNPMTIALRPRR